MDWVLGNLSLVFLIAVGLCFDFINGFNDSSAIVATMISTHAMSPRKALLMTAVFVLSGPFIFGVAVATTLGHQMVDGRLITLGVIYAALLAAILWTLITWYLGLPSSSTHAVVGGIVGSAVASKLFILVGSGSIHHVNDLWQAFNIVKAAGISKVLIALVISPILGFVAAYLMLKTIYFFGRVFRLKPWVNDVFRKGQIPAGMALALSYGANDAQKTMGILTMALVAHGTIRTFAVPEWIIALCASAIALGVGTGAWRLIKTLSNGIYKLRPVHGFTAQVSSATVILTAALLGGPVSTTHVVSSAIMGAGTADRVKKVRWGVGKSILTAWLLTLPATATLGAIIVIFTKGIK